MLVGKFVRACAVAFGAAVAACGGANAADLYGGGGYGGYGGYKDEPVFVPPPFWGGFYAGGFAGIAWSSIESTSNIIILSCSGVDPIGTQTTTGFIGGTQFGYNVQFGRFLYGIEADLGYLDDGTNVSFNNGSLGSLLRVTSTGGFLGDVTGRGGFVFGNALIYAKTGLALFNGDLRISAPSAGINLDSGTFWGWTVGAGAEYMLAPGWSVKAEYQYFDFSNDSGSLGGTITANTVKIGFNYFFNSAAFPPLF